MNPPLAMTRDSDGTIHDLYGRPVIMVFNSKPSRSTNNKLEADVAFPLAGAQDDPQPLAFINVPGTAQESTAVRTLIRTHVMQDYKRRKLMSKAGVCKTHKTKTIKHTAQENDNSVLTPLPSARPSQNLDPFARYPVQMQPYTYRLIHHYFTVIVPEMKEPGWKDPFPLAMKDAAFFHMLLLRSAVHINILTGNITSLEHVFHRMRVVQSINERLQIPTERLSDSLIIAIAFLAAVECTVGDYAAWNLHMNGLSRIIEMRGGLKTFEFSACLETNSRLRFPLSSDLFNCCINSGPRPLNLYNGFHAITASFPLDYEIITILSDLQRLHMFMIDMNPLYALNEIVCVTASLRYQLLSYAPTEAVISQSNILSEACRLGALLFLKPSICCQISYNDLLGKLTTCLESIEMNTDMKICEVSELVLWLIFLGGSTALDGPNRASLVAHLRKAASRLQITRWDDVKSVLNKFLWVEKIHEGSFFNLWRELVDRREEMSPSDQNRGGC